MDPMSRERNCSSISCYRSSVTSLDQQDFCLNHFLYHCYQRLEALDPRNRRVPSGHLNLAAIRAFVEECSRKALDISLHSENLTNLERGRLLDILLWAGELFVLLRNPRAAVPDPVATPEAELHTSSTHHN